MSSQLVPSQQHRSDKSTLRKAARVNFSDHVYGQYVSTICFIKAHAPSLLHLRERVCCHISTEAGGLVWHFRSQQLCKAFHSTTHPLCSVQSVKITAVSFSQQHLVNVTCVSHLHQVKQHFSSRLVSSYEDLMIGFVKRSLTLWSSLILTDRTREDGCRSLTLVLKCLQKWWISSSPISLGAPQEEQHPFLPRRSVSWC